MGAAMIPIFSYVIYFTPVVIVLAATEALVLAVGKKRPYNWRAALASVVDALGREYVVYTYLPFGLALPVIALAWNHRIATVPLSGPVAFGLLFIGVEFCFYWFPRASHRMPCFSPPPPLPHSSTHPTPSPPHRFPPPCPVTR